MVCIIMFTDRLFFIVYVNILSTVYLHLFMTNECIYLARIKQSTCILEGIPSNPVFMLLCNVVDLINILLSEIIHISYKRYNYSQ